MFSNINRTGQQQQSNIEPCTMEPMEGRILMAFNAFVKFDGIDGEAMATTELAAPTTGILIGLLLPAVQKAPG
jgi:hypothetical protein